MAKAKRVHTPTTKLIKRGDPGWAEKVREARNEMTEDFKAGRLGVENGWLIEYVDYCTCAGGTMETNGLHESHCGKCPIQDLVPPDVQFMVPKESPS